ncbi:MAG: hypothetical protein A2V86_14335 [Deltaproteobacteria bacterium RBG_16_49_23]|nr:MAG: hypothetical protein A2V86_14335 [Deltaproteobacteria bacterium RBG_16_49_23]
MQVLPKPEGIYGAVGYLYLCFDLGLPEVHRRRKGVRKATGVGGREDEERALEGVEGEGRDGLFVSREMGMSMIEIVRRL